MDRELAALQGNTEFSDPGQTFDLQRLRRACETSRPRHRPQLRRALRALKRLLDDPDQTQNAFEVGYALDGDLAEKKLSTLLACPAGRSVFRDKPCLLTALCDRQALLSLPADSFGRAYLEHIDRYELDPGKLVELRRETDPQHAGRDDDLRWLIERDDLTHDLWHALSGYGADGRGEGALLAFTLAQTYTRSGTLLTFGASSRLAQLVGPSWLPYLWRAWRRGRNAVQLCALPYERLLPVPLERVRQLVNIEDPETAHKNGVLRDPGPPNQINQTN
jgi:ubiquinone biosynthesis protein COQ4